MAGAASGTGRRAVRAMGFAGGRRSGARLYGPGGASAPRCCPVRAQGVVDRRPDGERAGGLLANRDMHYQNVLAGEREPWLVIDPKVMRGDAEFGLAPLLWRRLDEAGGPAGLRRRFDALVDEAGLDAELARGWTLLRAVDYQLWGLSLGLTEDPVRCATVLGWLSLTGSED